MHLREHVHLANRINRKSPVLIPACEMCGMKYDPDHRYDRLK